MSGTTKKIITDLAERRSQRTLTSSHNAIEKYAGKICEISAMVTDRTLIRPGEDPDLREQIYIACSYLLLRLTEGYLASGHKDSERDRLMRQLIDAVVHNAYGHLFSQDIVSAGALEYFSSFFETNYRLCAHQLVSHHIPFQDAEQADPHEVLKDFTGWFSNVSEAHLSEKLLSRLIWEAWSGEDMREKLQMLDKVSI